MSDRNWSRGVLALQALFIGAGGGLGVWVFPEEACPRMADLRAIVADAVVCPSYVAGNAVFEMYSFSLGKHHTMLGLLFGYFALLGRSRAAINAGFIYFAVAMSLDAVPVWTWLDPVTTTSWPPIARAGILFVLLAWVGVYWNGRAAEWRQSASL